MILTVTFNPAIDWNIIVEGPETRSIIESHRVAGGKGLNVSRVLNRLGTRNRVFAVLGGETGNEWLRLAGHEGLRPDVVQISSKTRVNRTILSMSESLQIKVDQPGPWVSAAELRRIASALRKKICSASIVVFSGSLPPGIPPRFLLDMINHANSLGKTTVVDTADRALAAVKTVPVWLIKPNATEWNSIRRSAPKAKWVLVTRGLKGAQLRQGGRTWEATFRAPQNVCTVGAGDSLLAGFLHEWLKTNDPAKALRFGVVCGTASVMNAPGRLADLRSIRRILRRGKTRRIKSC